MALVVFVEVVCRFFCDNGVVLFLFCVGRADIRETCNNGSGTELKSLSGNQTHKLTVSKSGTLRMRNGGHHRC